MSDFLSILTEEQRNTLTPEQTEKIQKLSDNNQTFANVVSKFNELLKHFFNQIEFCQHDSDYRPINNNINSPIIIIENEMFKLLEKYPDFHNEVFLYGINLYKLDEYAYSDKNSFADKDHNYYAAKQFGCVSKVEFYEYCKNNDLNPDSYLISDHQESDEEITNFSEYMDKFKKKYIYIIPNIIEINDGSHIRFTLFSKFNFINILKMQNDLSNLRTKTLYRGFDNSW